MASVTAVVFEGGNSSSPVEEIMAAARHALLLDNLEKLFQVRKINRIILVTNYPCLKKDAESLGVDVFFNTINSNSFHFGQKLLEIIQTEKITNLLYMGGAGVPLISVAELEYICSSILKNPGVVYTNNTQSVDIAAFSPAEALARVTLPKIDNSLASILESEAGLTLKLLPPSLGITFDVDTPTDLIMLAGSPFLKGRVKDVLDNSGFNLDKLKKIKKVCRGNYLEMALIGRVGAPVIAKLNSNFKVRLRIFSEERGMKSLGRDISGEAVSLMGLFMEKVGIESFFTMLEQVADAALIDSRVLFAHNKISASDNDRFYSDLMDWQRIEDGWIADFTHRAAISSIPLLLGGHSLVSGGIWLLVEEIGRMVPRR